MRGEGQTETTNRDDQLAVIDTDSSFTVPASAPTARLEHRVLSSKSRRGAGGDEGNAADRHLGVGRGWS
jgi:hypothetical protein